MNDNTNDYMIEFIEKLEFVNEQIQKDINQGYVNCKCGGKVSFTRSEYNGHLWLKCDKCNLNSMM